MEQLLKLFLKRLVQLDAGNRSLYLPKLSKEKDVDLHDFDFANGLSSFQLIEKLIAGKTIPMCPITDSRDASSNQLSERLKKILRKEKSITEETGAKDLYVGYPFVHGVTMGVCPSAARYYFFQFPWNKIASMDPGSPKLTTSQFQQKSLASICAFFSVKV